MKFLNSKKGSIPVYGHPDLMVPRYGRDFMGQGELYLGVPFRTEQLESAGANFIFQREPIKIRPDLWLRGEIPRNTDFELVDDRMLRKIGSISENIEFGGYFAKSLHGITNG